ncbi:MAG: flippase-like domain-containing protein [Bacteroidales bacterium]|nr:flippase-like domain-containing protein [Bacteroidales bacterium]
MKKTLILIGKFLFFLGIGIFFIWIFMRTLTPVEKKEIFHSFKQANYWWILLSMGLGILSHTSRTLRWKMLLKPMGYNPRFINVFFAVFIGYFANLALPRLGEVSRCGVLAKYEKIPFNKAFGTVFTERAIDLITFIMLFFINLSLQFNKLNSYIDQKIYTPLSEKFTNFNPNIILLYFFIGLVIIIVVFLILRKKISHTKIYIKIKEIILGFIEGLKSLILIEKPWLFIFHSITIWGLYFIMTYVVFFSMEETSSLSLVSGFAVFVFASIGIILVQGGIGIYPAIVAGTLLLYHIPETKGYAMGWLLWSAQTIMIIFAGIVSLSLLPMINKPKHAKA